MANTRRGLDGRHQDKGGKIEKKHGNTRVGSLRKEYGARLRQGSPQGHDAQDASRRDEIRFFT